jgi:hypothetical protein
MPATKEHPNFCASAKGDNTLDAKVLPVVLTLE